MVQDCVLASGGFHFVVGMKDTLRVFGAQISLTKIEDFLLAHPMKRIVAFVIGVFSLPEAYPDMRGNLEFGYCLVKKGTRL